MAAPIETTSQRPDTMEHEKPLPHDGVLETVLLVENIHCPSCVTHIQDTLRPFSQVSKVDVLMMTHEVRVQHTMATARPLTEALTEAAFDVEHVASYNLAGTKIEEFTPRRSLTHTNHAPTAWSTFFSRSQRKHIENCDACKNETRVSSKQARRGFHDLIKRAKRGSQSTPVLRRRPSDLENNSIQASDPETSFVIHIPETEITGEKDDKGAQAEYQARLTIGGMICASCSGTITKELEALDFVKTANVSLLANTGTVRYYGPRSNLDKLVEAVEEVGYEATVEEVQDMNASKPQGHDMGSQSVTANLSIDGMTCGSCVGTITRGLQELPYVRSVNISLVGNSGTVEVNHRTDIDGVLEKIDDLGYDATVMNITTEEQSSVPGSNERTIALAIGGMYCQHCPGRVQAVLSSITDRVTIQHHATLSDPVVNITYTPSPPEFTVRTLASLIEAADPAFNVKVYHPPSIEERSRTIQRREQWRILARLLFAFIVAIPTLIIGIIYMDLVSKSNSSRQWLEQPVWVGSVTRSEWALFVMTTPIMFFGADYFHTRALTEIKALWRKSSRVPIFRRFYRFGSMNLLISAGTAVAYFSSVAVLILDATSKPNHVGRSSDTYFDSVTFLTFFILIGKFLEAYSKAKTGDAVAMLSNLRPSEAHLITHQSKEADSSADLTASVKRIPLDLLEIGDMVSVPHGASPPSDGLIANAESAIFDESSLTGESKPVKKTTGDKVFAGSVNSGQPVQVTVTDIGGTSMLDQIVSVVREGQAKRAPIERVADVLTGYFVPVITAVAIITFVIWVSLGESGALPQRYLDTNKGGWTFWSLEFAIAVFVVACPCGLGLAAPTALFVGGGLAAKKGILVQGGGEAFQEASSMDAIVFDKTGTLTEGGSLKVTEHEVLNGSDPNEMQIAWNMAQMMEELSNHPIAKAVVEFCQSQVMGDSEVVSSTINEIGGQGMRASFTVRTSQGDSRSYEAVLGNQRLLASLPSFDHSSDFYLDQILGKYQNLGHSTTILALRQTQLGTSTTISNVPTETPASDPSLDSPFKPLIIFSISDPIRASALSVLSTLRTQHRISIHMCTGDNYTTAHAVASQLGIPASNVRANCLPADKATYIRALQQRSENTQIDGQKRKIIAFVGDGTNDTPALTAADVSIALSSGSDIAITTASFILLNPDLTTLLHLVHLARRVFRRVKFNFAWAAVYNIVLVPVAAGVFFRVTRDGWRLGPVWASVAMAASSVSVVCSSLALRWEGKKEKEGGEVEVR